MKAFTLLLAAVSGAGFLYRNQLQTLIHPSGQATHDLAQHHQAPEGVYYLRTAYHFAGTEGMMRWSPGQELRTALHTADNEDSITLTDGTNIAQVPKTAVTTDMDDAAAIRQLEASSQNTARSLASQEAARQQALALQQANAARQTDSNHLVSGQFHRNDLDAAAVRTNRSENIVSTAGAPVLYPVYRTVVVQQVPQPNRVTINQGGGSVQRIVRTASTPAPPVFSH